VTALRATINRCPPLPASEIRHRAYLLLFVLAAVWIGYWLRVHTNFWDMEFPLS